MSEPLVQPPRRLVGREAELRALRAEFEAVCNGACRVVLVSGAAGVGKSALVNELRGDVEGRGGLFISGKFDQLAEIESSAILQALEILGKRLAGLPRDELAAIRSSLLRALGAHAALLRVVPGLARVLPDIPDSRPLDTAEAAARLVEVVTAVLRAVAGRDRPLVLFLDDLQWGGSLATRLVENVLADGKLRHVLLAAAFRKDEVPASHALARAQLRWAQEPPSPVLLQLRGLSEADLAVLIGRQTGWSRPASRRLAAAIAPRTEGRPYDSIELVNGLHEEGLLADNVEAATAAVDSYVRSHRVADVLEARIGQLPNAARNLMETLACLGSGARLQVVRAAAGIPTDQECLQALSVLRARGLVAPSEMADGVVQPSHDHVQFAALGRLAAQDRRTLHLKIARRLAAVPGASGTAAEQYARAIDAISGRAEALAVLGILRSEAAAAHEIGSHGTALRLLQAAIQLLRSPALDGAVGEAENLACTVSLHLALCSVGRFEQADAVHASIEARRGDGLACVDADVAQVIGLGSRARGKEGLALGLRVLRTHGVDLEGLARDRAAMPEQIRKLADWTVRFDLAAECARADTADPHVVAAAKLLRAVWMPALHVNATLTPWIVFHARELWESRGPCAPLSTNLSRATFIAAALMPDFRVAYLAGRHMVEYCEARGWELDTALAKLMFAICAVHWFEPLERMTRMYEQAREGAILGGAPMYTAVAARGLCAWHFEATTLQQAVEAAEVALALSRRADYRSQVMGLQGDLQFFRCLLGETRGPDTFDSDGFEEASVFRDAAPETLLYLALEHTVTSVIFGDRPAAARHSRSAIGMQRSVPGFYALSWAYWLQGLSAAWAMRAEAADAPDGHARDLDAAIEWLGRRAKDAPFNFRHMHLHLLAEKAWVGGDHQEAAALFDSALASAEANRRPWHEGLIAEQAARLELEQGRPWAGARLLRGARHCYARWGAHAKVRQLDDELARFGPASAADTAALLPGAPTWDMAAVLRAIEELGHESSFAAMWARAEQLVGGITGAPSARILLCDGDAPRFRQREDTGAPSLPQKVLEHVKASAEPLVLADALEDDRFGAEGYFAGMDHCSLLAVPVLLRGELSGVLLLEDFRKRSAFDELDLDMATVLAGRLVVLIENAAFHDDLRRKVLEQSERLRSAEAELLAHARGSGMHTVATAVLNEVGNAVNSVNVSTRVLEQSMRASRVSRVREIAGLLSDGRARGNEALLPGYTHQLSEVLRSEQATALMELDRIVDGVRRIGEIVRMQQAYAGTMSVAEPVRVGDVVDDVLRLHERELARLGVEVRREDGEVPALRLDKARLMQILAQLVENAWHAMRDSPNDARAMTVIAREEPGGVVIEVADSGCGIAGPDLRRVFSHGFTTKPGSHGFGLHSCAVAAQEMGGRLSVQSDGPGEGARFVLRLPAADGGPPVTC